MAKKSKNGIIKAYAKANAKAHDGKGGPMEPNIGLTTGQGIMPMNNQRMPSPGGAPALVTSHPLPIPADNTVQPTYPSNVNPETDQRQAGIAKATKGLMGNQFAPITGVNGIMQNTGSAPGFGNGQPKLSPNPKQGNYPALQNSLRGKPAQPKQGLGNTLDGNLQRANQLRNMAKQAATMQNLYKPGGPKTFGVGVGP